MSNDSGAKVESYWQDGVLYYKVVGSGGLTIKDNLSSRAKAERFLRDQVLTVREEE